MFSSDAPDLSLHEAAEELGVHYMTAYRYVRQGLLPARKHQGTWRVQRSDLVVFQQRSGPGSQMDSPADGQRQAVTGRGRSRRAPWAQRLEARLIDGDDAGAWSVLDSTLAAGHDLESIYSKVMAPALESIGARWEAGELDIAAEHQATAIAARLVSRLGPRFARRGRSRGSVVIGAPAGETHGLPTAMLADLLRTAGWSVRELGADTPATSFVHAAMACDSLAAVGISVTHPDHRVRVPEIADAVHRALPGLLVVVGGRGVTDWLVDDRGAAPADVVVVDSAKEFLGLLESRSPRRLASGD